MGSRLSTPATISEPAARPRGGPVHRLLLHGAIPLAAALVVAWGVVGLDKPPPALTRSQAVPPAVDTAPGGVGSALARVSATTPPAMSVGTAASPEFGPASVAAVATPVPATPLATPSPIPTVAARPSPRPSATPPPRRTPTPVGAAVARACVPPAPLPPVDSDGSLVTTAEVNFRSGPGVECDAFGILAAGTELTPRSGAVRGGGRSWILVEVDGRTGWVAADFLQGASP